MSIFENFNSRQQNHLIALNMQTSVNDKTKISHPLMDRLPYSVVTSLSDIILKLGFLIPFTVLPMVKIVERAFLSQNYLFAIATSCAIIGCSAIGRKIMDYHHYIDYPLQEYIDARTLRKSHEEKNKPTALIIESTYDSNGALSMPQSRLFRYKNIIKNYKLHQVKVSDVNSFMKVIEEVGKVEKISLLWVKAHGDPTSIKLGPTREGTVYGKNLSKNIFKNSLKKNAITVLDSCWTGKPLNKWDNFACEFSKCAPGKIYAAKEETFFSNFSSNKIPSLKDMFYRDITVTYENGKLI
jgi:hypothetical protein